MWDSFCISTSVILSSIPLGCNPIALKILPVLARFERVVYYLNMHSENKLPNQNTVSRSFIEQARRDQIIEATIQTLARHGYINTSFLLIAKQAGISPSLIPYHFKDKAELTGATLKQLLKDRASYVEAQLTADMAASEKLQTILRADIDNMTTHKDRFRASAEIIFSLRSNDGSMVYLGDSAGRLFTILQDTLENGKKSGEFGDINAFHLAIMIEGARDSFLAQLGIRGGLNVEAFKKELVALVLKAVEKDNRI